MIRATHRMSDMHPTLPPLDEDGFILVEHKRHKSPVCHHSFMITQSPGKEEMKQSNYYQLLCDDDEDDDEDEDGGRENNIVGPTFKERNHSSTPRLVETKMHGSAKIECFSPLDDGSMITVLDSNCVAGSNNQGIDIVNVQATGVIIKTFAPVEQKDTEIMTVPTTIRGQGQSTSMDISHMIVHKDVLETTIKLNPNTLKPIEMLFYYFKMVCESNIPVPGFRFSRGGSVSHRSPFLSRRLGAFLKERVKEDDYDASHDVLDRTESLLQSPAEEEQNEDVTVSNNTTLDTAMNDDKALKTFESCNKLSKKTKTNVSLFVSNSSVRDRKWPTLLNLRGLLYACCFILGCYAYGVHSDSSDSTTKGGSNNSVVSHRHNRNQLHVDVSPPRIGSSNSLGSQRRQLQLQFNILTDENIHLAAYEWVTNIVEAFEFFGDISTWDTSRVTNMTSVFGYNNPYSNARSWASSFNGDLSRWNTSNVSDMSALFAGAQSFNGDISLWVTSKVTSMKRMFSEAYAFNGRLSSWNTSRVTNMESMFYQSQKFNDNLSSWDVSQVTYMFGMFAITFSFNQVLCWDTSKADTRDMFYMSSGRLASYPSCLTTGPLTSVPSPRPTTKPSARPTVPSNIMTDGNIHSAAFRWVTNNAYALAIYGDISTWDTSRVTNMTSVFGFNNRFSNGQMPSWASSFNGDLSMWDTSNVNDISYMFLGASAFNGDLSKWDTRKVTSMQSSFGGAYAFNGDLSKWDTSNVTSMLSSFGSASAFNGDLSKWDTSKVTNMKGMFIGAMAFNGKLSLWDTGRVIDMSMMFLDALRFNDDLSLWDTSQVTDMTSMFAWAESFRQVLCWDTSKAETKDMFQGSPGTLASYPSCLTARRTTKPSVYKLSKPPTTRRTKRPSVRPTRRPSSKPSVRQTKKPSARPTRKPSAKSSRRPTRKPSARPTRKPSAKPSRRPTRKPSARPTRKPSTKPSRRPTRKLSARPTRKPSAKPSRRPTRRPSVNPSVKRTRKPSGSSSRPSRKRPTKKPTQSCAHSICMMGPALSPICNKCVALITESDSYCSDVFWDEYCVEAVYSSCGLSACLPTIKPSLKPSIVQTKTKKPSIRPSRKPTRRPSRVPTAKPSRHPTRKPSVRPTVRPSALPTNQPIQSCAHSKCIIGLRLSPSCDWCVALISESDSYCSDVYWDDFCVDGVESICSISPCS